MPQTPSIKGSVFSYHAERLMKLVSAGEISREELERRLEPGRPRHPRERDPGDPVV